MGKSLAIILLGILCVRSAFAESWLCVADQVTGYDYEKSRNGWIERRFNPTSKFLVKRSEIAKFKWTVTSVGDPIPTFYCEDDFDKYGGVICHGWGEFRFQKEQLKFTASMTYAYFSELTDEKGKFTQPDSIMLIIGKCSSL